MLTVSAASGFGSIAAGGPAATATFKDSWSSTASGTSFTSSSISFGADVAGRQIVVGWSFSSHGTADPTSVDIGDDTGATQLYYRRSATQTDRKTGFYIGSPTGTAGTIIMNFDANEGWPGIGVWEVHNASSTANDTAFSEGSATPSLSIDCNGGGLIFAQVSWTTGGGGTAGGSLTWVGVTESYDAALSSQAYSGAFLTPATSQSGLTVSCNTANASTNMTCMSIDKA